MKVLLDTRNPNVSSEAGAPVEVPVSTDKVDRIGRYQARFRLALGGVICGGFLGIFGGALFGTLYGICVNDISLGLDGALLGSMVLAILGAVYGLAYGGGTGSEAPISLSDGRATHKTAED